MTLNKLPAIRSDLVRLDEHWKSWNFVQLVTSLESWIQRNPVTSTSYMGAAKKEKTYSTMGHDEDRVQQHGTRSCIYCDKDHMPSECTAVKTLGERKQILAKKKLCFNCAGARHQASVKASEDVQFVDAGITLQFVTKTQMAKLKSPLTI